MRREHNAFALRPKAWHGAAEAIIHDYFSSAAGTKARRHTSHSGLLLGALAGLWLGRWWAQKQPPPSPAVGVADPDTSEAERIASLAALVTHLQQQNEDERSQLARELHDELGSLLTAAKLDVARLKSRLGQGSDEMAQRVQHLTNTLNSGIALKRRIIEDLRPSSLSNLGLVAAIEILAREFADHSGMSIDTDLERVALPELAQLTVYRLVQQALRDIGRQATATTVSIAIHDAPDDVIITINDDGSDSDSQPLRDAAKNLLAIRHRIESVQGNMVVQPQVHAGITIRAWFPKQAGS